MTATVDLGGTLTAELNDPFWMHHATAVARTGFWAVAKRLPAIVREALGLAWRANRLDAALAVALNLGAGVLTTLGLLATSGVLGQLFAAGPTPGRVRAALPALVATAAAVMLRGALGIAAGWAQARIAPRITQQVELRMYGVTTAVELAAFDDAGFAEEMRRVEHRGMAEATSIVDSSVNLLTGVVGVVATAAAVAIIEPVLLPCVVLAAVPSAVTAVRMARRDYLAKLTWITRRRRMWMLSDVMANRHTAAEVRSYQMRGFLLAEYERLLSLETDAELRLARAQTLTRLIGTGVGGTATFAVYIVLGALLLAGAVPIAAAATAMLALQTARSGLHTAVYATNSLYEDALYYDDFRAFVRRADARLAPAGGDTAGPFAQMSLDAVSLRYPDTGAAAVDGVSLTLRRGEVIALVGENGSGKSSLAKLIAGLYRPSTGGITWNGVDTAGLDPAGMAAQTGVMSQDWWRFPFTAGQNIQIGRSPAVPGPGRDEAATAAAAHEMISDLPYGYETLLNREFKDGQDLSGGQWQRLVAARGFYRDARLLICDEPSAALDARAEHALFQQLGRRPDRAVVLITHRLANVRHADRIYVMERGRLVQSGTHEELIAAGGLYKELFELQASGYAAGPAD